MNLEKKIREKEKELKITEKIIEETLIISQQKYIELVEEKEKIELELQNLQQEIKAFKETWTTNEEGWRKRINKNE